jgi:pimeloyl-ACP methyl ester carboxylesterase
MTTIVDHYGRGYSDAPDTTYDTMFYLNELALLMQHVKFEKANLLGLSMVC